MDQKNVFSEASYETWKDAVEKSLKERSFRDLYTHTYEGITVKPVYTRTDRKEVLREGGFPGFAPYVRGIEPLGYLRNPWYVSQEIAAQSPGELNQIIKLGLAHGQTMVHITLDRATKRGYNSDQAKKEEVMNQGVPINTMADVKASFHEIPLNKIPLMVDTNYCHLPFLSQLVASNKSEQANLTGTVGMDPLAALVEEGELPVSLKRLYDVMTVVLSWSKQSAPSLRTILVKGHPYHNGGANAVQELAFSIATGVEYIHECIKRGLSIDEVAPRMTFAFSVGSNLFMEIAKFRAIKILWANVVKAFGGQETSQKITIHARTSAYTKTIYDPYVNMLRASTEAFSAAVGGINSLHVSCFDERTNSSNSFSRRIARNTQLILQEEAHLNKVIDPAGGSWYVEELTGELTEKAWSLFQQVEQYGGMYGALKKGFVQDEIKTIAQKKRRNVNERKDKIVGTNAYADLSEKQHDKEENQDRKYQQRIEKLTDMKVPRKEYEPFLDKVEQSCHDGEQALVRHAINAAASGATVGDIMDVLKKGQQRVTIQSIPSYRAAQSFELLRKAAEQHEKKSGSRPTIGLINLGSPTEHKPRADFMTGFFEAGGFKVVKNEGYYTINDAVKGTLSMNYSTYVICGTNQHYQEKASKIISRLKEIKPESTLYIAGKQTSEFEKLLKNAGVAGCIDSKTNCFETLLTIQKEMGVEHYE